MSGFLRQALGSVRVRVTATALLAVACALAVAAGVVDEGMQHYRQHILMTTAEAQARDVVALNPDGLTKPLVLPIDPTIDTGLVQVLSGGHVIGASRPLRYLPPLWDPGDSEVSTPQVVGELGHDVRAVAVPVLSGKDHGTVVVVTSLQQYDHGVSFVLGLMELGAPVLLVVLGVIIWAIVGRALRPIEMMRREVAEVATVRGTHRVVEPANDDEVGRLARTLNSMLDRIQSSSERERRFVSDASHELRSPIANIRTELEVALHHPGSADWGQVAGDVLEQNDRMERLVAGLLLLARSDEGNLPVAAEPVDLAEVVTALVGRAEGPVPVQVTATPATVHVPPVYLERMVANLVDNARRFARTSVQVSVTLDGSDALVKVRDDGPGVPEEDRQRIFERFVRLDEARHRGDGGFGLGLAIVADLSRFYGGGIEVRPADPGAEFVLRLPAAPAQMSAPVPVPAVT